MTPNPVIDGQFELITTEDPSEDVVRVALSTQNLRPGSKPGRGVPYKDWGRLNKPRVAEYGEFICTMAEDGPPGYQYIYFARAKSDEEKWVPVETREDPRVETWPEILEGLRFIENDLQPIAQRVPDDSDSSGVGTVFINRQEAALIVTPETTAECQAVLDIFIDARPFSGLTGPKPTPGHVSWDFGAAGGGQFTGLHSGVRIERPNAGNWKVVADATPSFVDAPFQEALIYPPTTMQTWRPFMYFEQQRTRGVYVLRRWTVYPPPKPKRIYR